MTKVDRPLPVFPFCGTECRGAQEICHARIGLDMQELVAARGSEIFVVAGARYLNYLSLDLV